MDYKNIELNASQKLVLRKFKNKTFSSDDLEKCDFEFFHKYKLIKAVNPLRTLDNEPTTYKLSDTGKMLILHNVRFFRRTWYPYIVSTLALIVSIIALFFS